MNELPEYPASIFNGRGIVMLAGGRYNGYAATGLGMIRETGSSLPVEVWMKDELEEKKGWCKELEKEGMVCRRLSDYIDVKFLEHGYQFKILTMLFSSFEQILFLDADNVPVRNPDIVFESKSFIDAGAVLWPDYWKHSGTPILPFVVGLADGASEILRAEQTVESGQIVWDKRRHWKVGIRIHEMSESFVLILLVSLFGHVLQLLWAPVLLHAHNPRLGWLGRQRYLPYSLEIAPRRLLYDPAQARNSFRQWYH